MMRIIYDEYGSIEPVFISHFSKVFPEVNVGIERTANSETEFDIVIQNLGWSAESGLRDYGLGVMAFFNQVVTFSRMREISESIQREMKRVEATPGNRVAFVSAGTEQSAKDENGFYGLRINYDVLFKPYGATRLL